MESSVSNPHGVLGHPDADEVRRELERILASPVFRGSKRCQDFLQYVVAKVLEGDARNLKERTLAVEVFGRAATEDLTDVSIVRVGAREVRKRLAQYYVHDGANDAVRIDLPPGSYIAVFSYHPAPGEPAVISDLERQPVAEPSALSKPAIPLRRRGLWLIPAALAMVILAALLWRRSSYTSNDFDVFWEPIFGQKSPVEILLAHPVAYHPSTRATKLDEDINGKPRLLVQRAIRVPPNLLNGSDFLPAVDRYVGFGDTVAALRLTSLIVQHHGVIRVRLASRVEFNDLLGSGIVLIGASFTNRWTAELTKNLRYQFGYYNEKPCIDDSQSGRRWTLSNKTDDGRSTEDYIIVCRLPHSQTNGFVLVCAGLNVYGTEEAGRILAQPESLVPILKKLPAGWANRNMELVLHLEVIGDAPALPEVVAAYTW